MITFFTTAKPFRGTTAIQQENCLQSLLHSAPGCEIFLFDAVEGAAEVCERLGLPAPLDVERSSEDTPRIDSMFGEVARRAKFPISCFINCDIIITPEFIRIVTRLHAELKNDYLLVGQRLNFDCEEALFPNEQWEARLQELAALGEVHPPAGSDQFVYPTGLFHRGNMPPLLVGRAAWDNWMFYDTLRHGRKLIDLSPTYMVYHQNHNYLHRKTTFVDYETDPEAFWNRQFMPKRGRGAHAYKLSRAGLELFEGKLRIKPLLYPGEIGERIICGGPDLAAPAALETPVSIILFKRPETLRQVVDSIRKSRPKYIYAIVDTAKEEDLETARKCADAWAELDRIDWPCRLRTHVADKNLGLARRVKSGLDWVFTQEDRCIILEDDIVADDDFFLFCEALLKRYKDDASIGSISGISFAKIKETKGTGYAYSAFPHWWGWATWRRAWEGFDLWMERWPEIRRQGLLEKMNSDPRVISGWSHIFDEAYSGKWDTWDFPWVLHNWVHRRLAVHPINSLTKNIGIGLEATHTKEQKSLNGLPVEKIKFPLLSPDKVESDQTRDVEIFLTCFDYRNRDRTKEAAVSKKSFSQPRSILQKIKEFPKAYALHDIASTLRAGKTNLANRKLRQFQPGDALEESHLLLSVQTLLTEGKRDEVLKILSKSKKIVDKSPVLLRLHHSLLDELVPPEFRFLIRKEPKLLPMFSLPRQTAGIAKTRMGKIEYTDAHNFLAQYNELFTQQLTRFDPKSDTPLIIDLGAETGLHLLAAKKRYPHARVWAYEPDDTRFAMLQRNVTRWELSDLVLHPAAISPTDGELIFNQQTSYDKLMGVGVRSSKVPSMSLASIVTEPVAFLRLNTGIQTANLLESIKEQLALVERILIEDFPAIIPDARLIELLRLLQQSGYRVELESLGPKISNPFRFYTLPREENGHLRIIARRKE